MAVSKAMKKLSQYYPEQRVLITGATSGLGEALAIEFADAGWSVAVTGRTTKKAEGAAKLVNQYGGKALPIVMEVTDPKDFEEAYKRIDAAWGGLDVLINNAGIAGTGRFDELSLESWHNLIDTNLWSVIYGCRAFLPLLKESGGGHIVNVASAAGLYCLPGMINYNVAKAGAIAISETLRAELAPDNIRVTVSCAEFFQSGLLDVDKAKTSSGGDNDLMAVRAKADVAASRYSSRDIARYTINSMAGRKLYSLPMCTTRMGWWGLRYFPESGRALMSYLFRKKLWKFAPTIS